MCKKCNQNFCTAHRIDDEHTCPNININNKFLIYGSKNDAQDKHNEGEIKNN